MLDPTLLRAIAREVAAAGGSNADYGDLVRVWERVQRRNGERADLIGREARDLAALLDHPEPEPAGRAGR
jgi:hypothetical protein